MKNVRLFSRRKVLKGVAAGALAMPALPRLINAQGLRSVTFTLSWLPEAFFAWAYVAKGKNCWKDHGLDVKISSGHGSIPTAQAMAASQFDFGISNSSAVILLASQGAKLNAIAMLDYESSTGVAVLDSSPIKKPKDLEGRKVGLTLASSDAAFFKPFCAVNKVDYSKVSVVNMDARVRNQALVEGKVDAISGFASSIVASIEASGTKVRMMLYSDYGVSVYGDISLIVPPERVTKEPELCQQFTSGLLEGLKYTLVNSDEAEKIYLDAVPETKLTGHGKEFARLGMAIQRFNVLASDDPRNNGLGWVDINKLEKATDFIMKYQAAASAKHPDPKAIFTNRFVGKVRLTADEWAKAKADTAFISKTLHNNS